MWATIFADVDTTNWPGVVTLLVTLIFGSGGFAYVVLNRWDKSTKAKAAAEEKQRAAKAAADERQRLALEEREIAHAKEVNKLREQATAYLKEQIDRFQALHAKAEAENQRKDAAMMAMAVDLANAKARVAELEREMASMRKRIDELEQDLLGS